MVEREAGSLIWVGVANSMAASGLSFRNTLIWHWVGCFSLSMHEQAEKTSPLKGPNFWQ